jgi:hypothetical protein
MRVVDCGVSKLLSGKESKMVPMQIVVTVGYGRCMVTKCFCGGVVILGFRSELTKDYGRLSKGPQKEARVGLKQFIRKIKLLE